MLRSLEQERAKYAWECIQEVKKESKELQEKYTSYVKKATTLIQANGLSSVLAFYYNRWKKNEKAYEFIYKHITNWSQLKKLTKGDLLQWIINDASSIEVFKASKEVIALLNWIRRFAEAELKGEEV
jgi:CRISPR-associated protein Cmr5